MDEEHVDHGTEQPSGGELTSDERILGMLAHLLPLIGLLISAGMLAFVGPLVIWLIKKEESPFIDHHGKESLNFQLTVLIVYAMLVAITVVTCGTMIFVTAPLLVATGFISMIFEIIASIKTNEGQYYQYPICIRFIG